MTFVSWLNKGKTFRFVAVVVVPEICVISNHVGGEYEK